MKHQLCSLLDQQLNLPSGCPPQRGGLGRLLILCPPAIPSTRVTCPYHLQRNNAMRKAPCPFRSVNWRLSRAESPLTLHKGKQSIAYLSKLSPCLRDGGQRPSDRSEWHTCHQSFWLFWNSDHTYYLTLCPAKKRETIAVVMWQMHGLWLTCWHKTGAKRRFGKCSILTGMAAMKYLMGQIDGEKLYSHLIPFQTSQLFQRLFIMTLWSPQVLLWTWAWLLGDTLLNQASWCGPQSGPPAAATLCITAPTIILNPSSGSTLGPWAQKRPFQILQLPISLIYLPLHQISFWSRLSWIPKLAQHLGKFISL